MVLQARGLKPPEAASFLLGIWHAWLALRLLCFWQGLLAKLQWFRPKPLDPLQVCGPWDKTAAKDLLSGMCLHTNLAVYGWAVRLCPMTQNVIMLLLHLCPVTPARVPANTAPGNSWCMQVRSDG